ncbi:MAG: AAA family ATPase, partial [Anaerolineae bacterium]|nr:AAA family ATPase [Anaerolineae bacterium]
LPYQPLVKALRLALPLHDRWRHTLPIWLAEVSRLLPELRGHFLDLPPPVEVAPQQAQTRLFEALTQVFCSLTNDSPLLLCLDDVHWADEATLDWLEYVTNRLAGSGICIFGTYRSHRAASLADWRRALNRAGLAAPIRLDGLSVTAVTELLHQVGAKQAVAKSLAVRVHAATGGNAFFEMETVRELLETNKISDASAGLPLPQTVRDAVSRRTARLTPLARQVLAVAAVLSPHLRVETLVETSGRGEVETVDSLDELLAHHLLRADGSGFRFQHDLARQAVYEETSPWRRRLLHRRAAEKLEQIYQAELAGAYDTISSQIAAHYEQAGRFGKAISYYQQAATAAQRIYAITEAYNYTVKGLALLEKVADKSDYAAQELDLQLLLGVTLLDTERMFDSQIEAAFGRAVELSKQLQEPLKQATALQGLSYFNGARTRLEQRYSWTEQLLALAQALDNSQFLMFAQWNLGDIALFRGQFTKARKHLEQAKAHHQRGDVTPTISFGLTPDTACLAFLAQTLQLLGYSDQALAHIHSAITLAEQAEHPLYLVPSLMIKTQLHQQRGDGTATLAAARQLLSLSGQIQVPILHLVGHLYTGWALFTQGQKENGLDYLNQALFTLQQIPPFPATPVYLSILAEIYIRAGQLKKAGDILDRAWTVMEEAGLRISEVDLCMLRGVLFWQQ